MPVWAVVAQGVPVTVTPPSDPKQFLPWALSVALAVILFLFWLREKERKEQLSDLKAKIQATDAEREREREEHKTALEKLGGKLDAEKEARARDHYRMARFILSSRDKLDEPNDREFEDDVPTGVHRILQAVPTTDRVRLPTVERPLDHGLDERLRKFDPYAPTTPPAPPPRPRSKLGSRPDR